MTDEAISAKDLHRLEAPPAPHLALAPRPAPSSVERVTPSNPDRTRMLLMLTVALWASALAVLFIGFRLHLKPVILIGALDAALAFGATSLLLASRRKS